MSLMFVVIDPEAYREPVETQSGIRCEIVRQRNRRQHRPWTFFAAARLRVQAPLPPVESPADVFDTRTEGPLHHLEPVGGTRLHRLQLLDGAVVHGQQGHEHEPAANACGHRPGRTTPRPRRG